MGPDENGIGIDFGTTNSSVAWVNRDGEVELARFPHMGSETDAYRSLLYLEQTHARGAKPVNSWSGPDAIERYLAADPKGRLIQSLKSFLSSRSLLSTDVFGRRRTLEELIARVLRDLREKAERQFGIQIQHAVVGRPVRFVGAEKEEDNTYAEQRLREAFAQAGFPSVDLVMEPVAAAYHYQSTLDHDELILIGDFGGGTSDFSLVQASPASMSAKRRKKALLGNAGVGLAGDAFDAKIVRHLVSPELGAGGYLESMGKTLPVPTWVYSKLERWHHLSFLKARDTMTMLASVHRQAQEPEKIQALIHLIEEDLGYQLHQAVQRAKVQLSNSRQAQFHFRHAGFEIQQDVDRESFEDWIAEELAQIEGTVDSLLASAKVGRERVDVVFLTGGTSLVPAVRRIFELRFGGERIRTGNEFTSVARGLALQAAKNAGT
jgi:hypothetical chaperone protein